jgi:hypothetical protein
MYAVHCIKAPVTKSRQTDMQPAGDSTLAAGRSTDMLQASCEGEGHKQQSLNCKLVRSCSHLQRPSPVLNELCVHLELLHSILLRQWGHDHTPAAHKATRSSIQCGVKQSAADTVSSRKRHQHQGSSWQQIHSRHASMLIQQQTPLHWQPAGHWPGMFPTCQLSLTLYSKLHPGPSN